MGAITLLSNEIHLQQNGTSPLDENPFAFKFVGIEVPATVDDGDTIAVTLSDVGLTTFWFIQGFTHSTTDDIIITEAPSTSVTTGVLTITVGGSTDNKKRFFLIGGV